MALAPAAGGLPFEEAIAFLRAKLGRLLPSNGYTDTLGRMNSVGFAVAGAWKDALLRELHAAVLHTLETGGTVKQFQARFEDIAARHKWEYRGSPAWRARTILETNLRSAYQAGRWQQAQRLKASRPFLRYVAVMDSRTRPLHRQWHGTILPVDHAWWRRFFPPNGWGCRCTVQSLSARDLDRRGWKVTEALPGGTEVELTVSGVGRVRVPEGIDPGFDHNPGQVLELPFVPQLVDDLAAGAVPPMARNAARQALLGTRSPPVDQPLPAMPPPRRLDPARLLPPDASDEEAVRAFLAEFGSLEGEPVIWQDRAGGAVGIGRRMFETAGGALKIGKGNRREYLRLLADAMHDPDEVWVALEVLGTDRVLPDGTRQAARVVVRRRHVMRYRDAEGNDLAGVAAFEWDGSAWQGRTVFTPSRDQYGGDPAAFDPQAYLDQRARFGVRIYVRGQN